MMNKIIDKNIYKLAFVGGITGIIASVVGGGAEILLIPLLIYFKIFKEYKTAIGTSLASLLLPIGIFAVYFYSKSKCEGGSCVNWKYALIISFFFTLGTSISYFTVKLETRFLRLLFGIITTFLGLIIIYEEIN